MNVGGQRRENGIPVLDERLSPNPREGGVKTVCSVDLAARAQDRLPPFDRPGSAATTDLPVNCSTVSNFFYGAAGQRPDGATGRIELADEFLDTGRCLLGVQLPLGG
jgi:hypothetical protein